MIRCSCCSFLLPEQDFRAREGGKGRRGSCMRCEADMASRRRGRVLFRVPCDACGEPVSPDLLGGPSGLTCTSCRSAASTAADAERVARWSERSRLLQQRIGEAAGRGRSSDL